MLCAVASGYLYAHTGVLAALKLPDGSEYIVVQRIGEPFGVDFYMKPSGGRWGWCYIDHQADRWRDVDITYDAAADSVTVTASGARRAALDRRRGMFWINTFSSEREVEAPQEYRRPGLRDRLRVRYTKSSNQGMQLTASKLVVLPSGVCHRRLRLRGARIALAAADLVSR
jgi:hypothetical protein